ncbi:hypothetical protein [Candidatus Accumulibacter phosphatis]|uniref:hypothetical protein n=1 Tax=Candidatus Accumulibacter phosphatis TaxID=327160 RepID=UPI00110B0D8F|nr:hypothetical protein [Candidatus Accumulibacter phosphatis]
MNFELPRFPFISLSVAGTLLTACATNGSGDFLAQLKSGQEKAERIANQVSQIPPPLLPDLPKRINRRSFGRMHTHAEFVMYDCSNVLTPEGNRCPIGEVLIHALDAQNVSLAMTDALFPDSFLMFDTELVRLGLREHFKYAGAVEYANVSVVTSDRDKIDFLVRYPSATLGEAQEAAKAYCSKFAKRANFFGASVACAPPDATMLQAQEQADMLMNKWTKGRVNRRGSVWRTYAILAFDCETIDTSSEFGDGTDKQPAARDKPRNRK